MGTCNFHMNPSTGLEMQGALPLMVGAIADTWELPPNKEALGRQEHKVGCLHPSPPQLCHVDLVPTQSLSTAIVHLLLPICHLLTLLCH